ncbi:PREDICTED: glutathione S-transferase T3-like [Brassica oleracea var. oleracea]|uniref:glutathione S-transferase T3-like n=1 Tax=Brassica oleracea var. oleracea TaxID=109376 RepID=UPI0006A73562|nr:PREDICTED: glutathione S-transferase T3-like [Brassica oleracea var. oleracea]
MDPLYVNSTGFVHSPGFVNLSSSQNTQTIDVESSQFPSFSSQSSVGPKPLERRKWTAKEDLVLISAWLNTSKDPIVGNEQKAGAFWKRIEVYINANPRLNGCPPRESSQCKQRWGRVNDSVGKFVGSFEAALKNQASGQNENDVMKVAHEIFTNDHGALFSLEHCWRELRFDQKWRSQYLSKDGAKDKGKESADKRKDQAEVVVEDDEVRPPGVKASKAAKRRKHGNEAAFDQINDILAVKNEMSKNKILSCLLAKPKDTLSDIEVSLKNKLISEML